jgi:hypothetical protein
MARKGGALILASAVLTLAACSGSDGDASLSTVPVTVAPTTAAPTTTSAPTTTEAPTTTIDPAVALAAEVEADFRETIRLTSVALQEPTNEAKVAAALEGYIEANRVFMEERFDEFRTNGWVVRENPDVAADLIIEEPARLIPPSSDVVEVQVCEIDPWVVVEPGAGPNGTDAIVDDALYTYRSIFFLRLIDGRWRAEGSRELGRWTGLETCPDA